VSWEKGKCLYINDIYKIAEDTNIKLFADDTNIFLFKDTIPDLYDSANKVLEKLGMWFHANKLSINIEKTQYILFNKNGQAKQMEPLPSLVLNNKKIEKVCSCKYLGVIVDENLSFKEHINNVIKKIRQFCGIFYKLRLKIPSVCLKTMYYAFVHSHINYGLEIYGNTFKTYIEPLQIMNNKILRIIQNKPIYTPVNQLYVNFNTLPITTLRYFNILRMVHKYIHHTKELPLIYHNYFIFSSQIHDHDTRSSGNLYQPSVESVFGMRNTKCLGCRLWNKIPASFKSIKSINRFKKSLKLNLLHNQEQWSIV
jgi:hypothetical protein